MWNWPEHARLAVATVVHLDGGWAQQHPQPPDLHYGHHAGFERLARVLQRSDLPVGWVLSDHRLQQLPQIADFIAQRSDDYLVCTERSDVDAGEPGQIARAAQLLEGMDAARGWLGHPMRSPQTAALLVTHGFDHVLAASPLDLPFHLDVPSSPGLIVQPLLEELSDLHLLGPGAMSAELWLQALIDSVDTLLEEAEAVDEPRQLTLQLHLPVIARPSRIRALEQICHYLDQLDGVWRSTPGAIAAHVRSVL